jgi:hypothetical protein
MPSVAARVALTSYWHTFPLLGEDHLAATNLRMISTLVSPHSPFFSIRPGLLGFFYPDISMPNPIHYIALVDGIQYENLVGDAMEFAVGAVVFLIVFGSVDVQACNHPYFSHVSPGQGRAYPQLPLAVPAQITSPQASMTRLLLDSLNSLNRMTKVVRMTSRVVAVVLGMALSHLSTHTQRLNVHVPLLHLH